VGSIVSSILANNQAVNSVLSNYVGDRLWSSLSVGVREHLTEALTRLSNNESGEQIIRAAGLALDLYLDDFGQSLGPPFVGMTMGAKAQELASQKLIVKKQTGLTEYGVLLRNAAEHPDTDPDLAGSHWTLTTNTSMTYLRVVLDTLRSLAAKIEGRFEL
jgi:hypothetical protein